MTGISLFSLYYRLIRISVATIRDPRKLDRLSDLFARIRHRLSGNTSTLYSAHIRRVFPDLNSDELETILASYWKTHERNLIGLFSFVREEPSETLKRVVWKGRDILDHSVQSGRGVILLVPHYGDERGLHVLMGMAGYKVSVITSRYADMPLFCRKAKLAPGDKWNTLHFPDENPRWMYRTLEQGDVLHYGSTAYGGPGGTWITAFGVPILLPSAPWKLWRRTGCAVLGAYCTQTPGMSWEISFEKLETPLDRREFAMVMGNAAAKTARSNPGQYEWKTLAVRHRETNTIIRTGKIPEDEKKLEDSAIPEDSDPAVIHQEAACLRP